MASSGPFRIGEKVSFASTNGKNITGVVVGAVGWRECVLTMGDEDAMLFTALVRSKVGDAGVAKYQKVAVMVDGSASMVWQENYLLTRVGGTDGQVEVSSVAQQGDGGSGANS